jgi:hypothetical protein
MRDGKVPKIYLKYKWTLYWYWDQTKLIQLWNLILDVYQSRDKSFSNSPLD